MKKNLFISIEGIEGAGKSTIIPLLCAWLRSVQHTVVQTREPGGCTISEAIRQVVLTPYDTCMHKDCELLLMLAARSQHLFEVILPALARGETVVTDRFRDATLAYQGGGRGISLERILELEHWCQQRSLPDKTFYLDISLEESHRRRQDRKLSDRMEQEQDQFFECVRRMYIQLAKEDPRRIIIIEASKSPKDILKEMQVALEDHA